MAYTQKESIAFIREMVTTKMDWAYRALMTIYMAQTEDEKACNDTKHENGVGFTGHDAEILTSFAKGYEQYGHLTDKQLRCLFNKIGKYAGQLYRSCDKDKLVKTMDKFNNKVEDENWAKTVVITDEIRHKYFVDYGTMNIWSKDEYNKFCIARVLHKRDMVENANLHKEDENELWSCFTETSCVCGFKYSVDSGD
jgi:hypothetical protein